jgi:acetylornithine deacetylase/succinyl-diaminopimelate desuccinylase-like protein
MTEDTRATAQPAPTADAVLGHVDEAWTIDLLQRAVQTPSVTGDEAAFARLVEETLRQIGLDRVELFDFKPGRPDVVGVLQGAGEGPGLMFLGHLDTVHVRGWEERWRGTERESPFSGAIVEGELYGRGAGDQKAGIVAVLGALKALRDAGARPKGDVAVAFVGDEESGEPGSGYSDGIKAVVERMRTGDLPRADFAVYTEPTELDIYAAQMGFMTADITVVGESAYFGKPWLGIDALKGAHRLLADLFEHSERIWRDRGEHPLLGRAFLLVTGIEGGGYIAVPERCKLSLIRKVLPTETLDDARSELDEVVRKLDFPEGIRTEIEYTAPRDHAFGGTPAEVPADLPAVERLGERIRSVTGKEDVIRGAPYWSEISFLHPLGIPAVFCGPGDITNCHTLNERVEVRQLIDGARVFAGFIADHCGLEGGG